MLNTNQELDHTSSWIMALPQPLQPALLRAAAFTCFELRQYSTAVSILELCIALESENSTAHLLLGQSLLALNQFEKATLALELSLVLDPDCLEAKSLLLFCYTGTPS